MNRRQRSIPTGVGGPPHVAPPPSVSPFSEIFNIIPIHNLLRDHPSLRYPEVRAAAAALRTVGELRKPPFMDWRDSMNLLDWLGMFFGFQDDNVKNQREHLVLHLANSQMRLQPPPAVVDRLDQGVLQRFRQKLLKNYTCWCSYLGKKSQVRLPHRQNPDVLRRKLFYVCLYLLVWGEAANLRFMPECLCYIYHHMAFELNYILDGHIDERTAQPYPDPMSNRNGMLRLNKVGVYLKLQTISRRSS